jgi:acetolactate synthase I/II/III large subunit
VRVSDYLVSFFDARGIHTVFGYPGGMVTYLMDSLYKHPRIQNCLLYHEQGVSFAACGYGQLSGEPTVAYATSGPGATNMVTGIANAWFDSIPVVFITGQVNTYESKTTEQIRQKGFQETNILDIVRSITKYAVQVTDATQIRYELEKAFHISVEGRKGPTLLDLPMNVLRADVDPEMLARYQPEASSVDNAATASSQLLSLLQEATRPCLLLGNGAHNAPREWLADIIRRFDLPFVTSMPAVDFGSLVPENYYGFIGAYGNRVANQILEKCTLLISMGSRLDMRQTGFDKKLFATHAKILRIDVDCGELENHVHEDEVCHCCDIKDVTQHMIALSSVLFEHHLWKQECLQIRQLLQGVDIMLEPNRIIAHFSTLVPEEAIITTDVGQNQVWVAQSFRTQPGQRILFSSGHGAMGYSLPAAIGAYYAAHMPVIAFCGDGGMQMNIQELQVLAREQLPIKVVLLNNFALGMIRHFQQMYFDDINAYTIGTGGYSVPDFLAIVAAYGLRTLRYDKHQDEPIRAILRDDKPAFIEIDMPYKTYITPKSVYNKPLSFQVPALPRDIQDQMDQI